MLVIYRKELNQIHRKEFYQIHIFKIKRQFRISGENVIRSIPAYDSVIGKRKDKAVRLFYRQNPVEESVKGEPPCVLGITVQSLKFLHTANLSHISITFQLFQRCGQFG